MMEGQEAAAPLPTLDERARDVLAALDDVTAPPTEVGEAETRQSDDEAAAPISWSKEEKALFRKLPPELQAAVARREAERERFLSTRNQDLARLQKELAGERARVDVQLDALIAEAERDPAVLEGGRLDWDRLRREQPAVFARKWPLYQQRAEAIEIARTQRATSTEAALSEERAREHAAIAARLPEWSDPAKRDALSRDLCAFLGEEGYSPAEIATIRDHRSFLIAVDAMRWRREQEARKTLVKKKVAPTPRTQKPGAVDDGGAASGRLAALKRRALQSGRLDDRAAYVLAALDDGE